MNKEQWYGNSQSCRTWEQDKSGENRPQCPAIGSLFQTPGFKSTYIPQNTFTK